MRSTANPCSLNLFSAQPSRSEIELRSAYLGTVTYKEMGTFLVYGNSNNDSQILAQMASVNV